MAAEFSCENVNDLFTRESGRYSIDIHERYNMEDPWGRLIRVDKFPQGMGTSINELTVERVDTGSFEDDWSDVALSNGTGASNGCNPSPTDLEFGQTARNWNLQTKSYRTPCICLDDLKTSFQIQQQVSKTITQLTLATKRILSNRRRSEYMRQVPLISVGNGTFGTEFTGSTSLSGVPVPQALLSQDLLDRYRVTLLRNGAGHNALAMEAGQAVLGLVTSGETSRDLLRRNPDIRQDIRWAKPNELLAPLGVDRSYGGFAHIIDIEIPRFDYNGAAFVRRYPFVRSSTTQGYKWEPNPLYDAAAFEMSFIFHIDVYSEAVQQVGPSIPDAPFKDYPHYYSGQVFWNNFLSDENPLGKKGRWLIIFQNGSKPIAPYLGRAFLHRRCPDDMSYQSCSYPYVY